MRTIPLEQPLADLLAERDAIDLQLRDAEPAQRERLEQELQRIVDEYESLRRDIFASLTPMDQVALARHPDRPYTLDYLSFLMGEFIELHGDRRYGDDGAIVAGLGLLGERAVAVVGCQKGRNVAERKARRFGQPTAFGYRKGMRVMDLAARQGSPVLTFIDTPGAACDPEAEELGISEAIASSQLHLAGLPVPTVACVIGEGGSGGAIALGLADWVIMLEHSYYSVIAPESCASIIWRDASRHAEAAEALRLCAADALEFGFCDEVIDEPVGGAHAAPGEMAERLEAALLAALARLDGIPPDELREQRYAKFRAMGRFATAA